MAEANVDSTQQSQDAQTLDNLTSLQQADSGTTTTATGGTADAVVTTTNPPAPDTPSLFNETTGTNNNQPNFEAATTNSLLDTTTFTNDGRDGTANESPTIGSGIGLGTDVNTGESQVQYTVTNENPIIQGAGTKGTQNTVGGIQGTAAAAAPTESTATTEAAPTTTTTDAPTTNSTPEPIVNPDGTTPTDPTVDPLTTDPVPQEPVSLLTSITLKLFAVVDSNQAGAIAYGGKYLVAANTMAEDGGTGTYIVLAQDSNGDLGNGGGGTVTVNVGTGSNPDATRGTDFDMNGETGGVQNSATRSVTVGTAFTMKGVDDFLADNNETYTVTLGSDWSEAGKYEKVNYTGTVTTTIVDETANDVIPGTPPTAGDLTDNDVAYTLKLFAVVDSNQAGAIAYGGKYLVAANTMAEDGGTGTYIVLAQDSNGDLGNGGGGTVTVNVGTGSNPDATRGTDFDMNGETGGVQNSATRSVTVGTAFTMKGVDDFLADNNETYTVTLGSDWSEAGKYEKVNYTGTVTTTIVDETANDVIPGTPPTAGDLTDNDVAYTLKLFAVVDSNQAGAIAYGGKYLVAANTMAEDGGTGTYIVLAQDSNGDLGNGGGGTVTVNVGTGSNPDATRGTDFDMNGETGGVQNSATRSVTVGTAFTMKGVDDFLADNNETYTVTLGSDWSEAGKYEKVNYTGTVTTTIVDETANDVIPGTPPTAGDLTDNDVAYTLKLFAVVDSNQAGAIAYGGKYLVAANTMAEDGGTGTYIVLAQDSNGDLGNGGGGTVTVNVGTGSNPDATRGTDFDMNGETGGVQNSATRSVTVGTAFTMKGVDDFLADNNETYTVTLGSDWSEAGKYEKVNYTGTVTTTIVDETANDVIPGTPPTAGDLTDNDVAYTLKLFAVVDSNQAGAIAYGGKYLVAANTMAEDGGTGTYIVLAQDSNGDLGNGGGGTVTVNVGTGSNPDATRGTDFDMNGETGGVQNSATRSVTVGTAFTMKGVDDFLADNNETYTVTLGSDWSEAGKYEKVNYTGTVTTTIVDETANDVIPGTPPTAGDLTDNDVAYTLKLFAVVDSNQAGAIAYGGKYLVAANTMAEDGGTGTYIVLAQDSNGDLGNGGGGTVTVNVGTGSNPDATRGTDFDMNGETGGVQNSATRSVTVGTAFTMKGVDDFLADNNETYTVTLGSDWSEAGKYEKVNYTGTVTTTIVDETANDVIPGTPPTAGDLTDNDVAYTLKLFAVVDSNQAGAIAYGGKYLVAANTMAEDGGTGTYIVLAQDSNGDLGNGGGGTVTVNVGTGSNPDATRGTDFDMNGETGGVQNSATRSVTVGTAFTMKGVDDFLADNNETYTVTLGSDWSEAGKYEKVNYTGTVTTTIVDETANDVIPGTPPTAGDLTDNDVAYTLKLFAVVDSNQAGAIAYGGKYLVAANTMAEDGGTGTYIVLAQDSNGDLGNGGGGTVTVNVGTGSNPDATRGTDFDMNGETGGVQNSATRSVTVGTAFTMKGVDDFLADNNETYTVTLGSDWSEAGKYEKVNYTGTVTTTIVDETANDVIPGTPPTAGDLTDNDVAYTLKLFAVVDSNQAGAIAYGGKYLVAANTMAEDGGTGTYIVLAQDSNGDLGNGGGGTVTVNVGTGSNPDATRGTDFDMNGETGGVQNSATRSVTVGTAFTMKGVDDFLADNNETYTVTLGSDWSEAGKYEKVNYTGTVTTTIVDETANDVIPGTPPTAGDLTDNDVAYTLKLFAVVDSNQAGAIAYGGKYLVAANTMAEDGGTGTYIVLAQDSNGDLGNGGGGTVTVNVGTGSNPDATRGTDFDMNGETGGVQNSATRSVTVGTAFTMKGVDDFLADNNETYTVTLGSDWSEAGKYEKVNYTGTVTTTIVDETANDVIPGTPPTAGDLTDNDVAYTLKLFAVVDSNQAGAIAYGGKYLVAANTMAEDGGTGTYIVLAQDSNGDLGNGGGGTVTVNVGTGSNPDATRGTDFDMNGETGGVQNSATRSVTVGTAFTMKGVDDFLADNNETYTVTLGSDWSEAGKYEKVNYTGTVTTTIVDETANDVIPGTPPTAGDLTDNDVAYTLKLFAVVDSNQAGAIAYGGKYLVAANTMAEDGGTGTYIVLAQDSNGDLGNGGGGTVTVNVGTGSNPDATRGTDFDMNGETGGVQNSATRSVTVGTAFTMKGVDDFLADNNETYTVTLGSDWSEAGKYEKVNYTGTVTTTIVDNDPLPISEISIWKKGTVYNDNTFSNLVKDDNNQVDLASDFIQYEVFIKNTGNNTLTGIKITDEKLLDGFYTLQVGTFDGIQFIPASPSSGVSGSVVNGELSLNSSYLFLADQALRLVYNYDVTSDDIYSNKISNTVQVDTDQTDFSYKDDPTLANDGIASYEILVEGISDVAIRKFADVRSTTLGGTINYQLIVTNEGTTSLTNVKISDKMIATANDVDSVAAGKQISGYVWTNGVRASTATNFTVDANGDLVIGQLNINQYVEINYSHIITANDYSVVKTGLVESIFDYTGVSKGPYNPDGNSSTIDPITMSYGTFSAYVNKDSGNPYATGGSSANIFINTDNTGLAIGVNAGVMSGDRNYNSDHLKAVFNSSSLNSGKSLVEKASVVFTNAKDVEVAFKAGYGALGNTFTGSIVIDNNGILSLKEVLPNGTLSSLGSSSKSGSITTFTNGTVGFSVDEASGPGGAQNKIYTLTFAPGTNYVKDFDFWVVGDPTDNSSDQIKVVDILFDTIDFTVSKVENIAIVTSTEDNAVDQSDEIARADVTILANMDSTAVSFLGELTNAKNLVADNEAVLTQTGSVQWGYSNNKGVKTLDIQLPKISITDADNNPTTVNNFVYTLEINNLTIQAKSATSSAVTFDLGNLTGVQSGVFHLYTFDNLGGRTEFISSGITIDTSKASVNGNLASFSKIAPIVFDLNGDGISFISQSLGITHDYNHDGIAESTAWVAPEDGLLALQKEDSTHNIVFSTQAGETDLQGLAKVYDSNKDGVLDQSDADFAKFGVWQDADSDGVVDSGEYLSLADRGITSLSLTSDGQVHFEANGDVIVYGQTTYTTSDGQLHIAEDVGFAVSDVYEPLDIATIIANADAIESVTHIDQSADTASSSSLMVELGGQTYEIATLAGQEAGTQDILSQFVGGDTSANLLTNKSWTDVIDISSDHGGPGSIIAAGGTLNEGNYANGEGDWTVIINSGDAKVDATNNQITFASESADNSVTIITADGASHDINNVDKIQWHG